ncbi:MAG: hypothetical protein NZL96_00475 [Patescibacteria group bacterium]|nr:hypothetical protein [Patescibacteria group bacterium]
MKKPIINLADFEKFDIRVGKVIEASKVPHTDRLIKLKVDLGEDYGIVQIITGIGDQHQPEDLVGNLYPFLANLEPKKIRGELSEGMLLLIDDVEKVTLITLDNNIKPGKIIR